MSQPNDLKQLTESFFKSLNSNISWSGPILKVSNVPSDFEQLFGKKSPYNLAFSDQEVTKETELISKGSFMLNAITEYLDKKGQMTSIKLDFNEDFLAAFKRYLKLKNAEIQSLTKTEEYKQIYKFTFQTLLQYLNEKEQIINSLYLQQGNIIQFNIDNYKSSSFNSKEDYQEETKRAYASAKENLKSLIMPRMQETSLILKQKLKNEQTRIQNHYSNQRNELQQAIKRAKDNLIELEKQKSKDPGNLQLWSKESKIKEHISALENSEIHEKLNQEEKFLLNDELHKHSLNISTKLLNTTIINCPIFKFNITLKSKDSARQLSFSFDPITQELTPKITCELCSLPIQELFLCSSGHLSCVNCLRKCMDCSKELCSKCIQSSCNHCAKRLCRRCAKKCPDCHATICSYHAKINRLTGQPACTRCLQQCIKCSNYYPKSHLKDNICTACSRLSNLKKKFED